MLIGLLLYAIHLSGLFPGTSSCAYFPRLSYPDIPLEPQDDPLVALRLTAFRHPLTGFKAPVTYHPTALLQKYTVMDAPPNSACLKCGLCMAVSERLEQILRFALTSSISLQDFDDSLSAQLLRPICDFSFQSYGLKEWKGLRVISSYHFLDSVPNSMEGRWWEVLKESCHNYLDHFGEGNLVKSWLVESQNVTGLLCRNGGLFRDCLNIEQSVLTIQLPKRLLFPSNHIQINYPCP